MTRTWHVSSVIDAARARIATARLATAHGVSATDRARLVSVLTAQLRQCLTKGGVWLLTARATTARPGGSRFLVEVTSANRRPGEFRQPWRLTVACAQEGRLPDSEHVPGDPVTLAEALFGADEDAALLLEKLDEQEALVAFHREELHQTNQGVLALHAELDAAGRAQRELFAAEQKAREEAENARGRLTFLADASAALTASLNPDAIVRLLPTLLVPRYARTADVWLFDGEDDVARGGPRPAAAVVAARRGRPQYAADHPGGLPGVDDQPPSALDPARPLLCVPLMTRRAPLGVLTLSPPDDERWDADDAFMLIELARRAGVALENARRFEHNRDIAETLQRALLTELPTTPGLRLAARYLPATRGLNIGGDWYDAFRQPDGGLITVIGDVTGHGLRAAVMMSQLRTALRAYAVDGETPGGSSPVSICSCTICSPICTPPPSSPGSIRGSPPSPGPPRGIHRRCCAHPTGGCASWTPSPARCSASPSIRRSPTTPSRCRPARPWRSTRTDWWNAAPRASTRASSSWRPSSKRSRPPRSTTISRSPPTSSSIRCWTTSTRTTCACCSAMCTATPGTSRPGPADDSPQGPQYLLDPRTLGR